DLLLTAAQELHDQGFKVGAFVDLYAPKWIQTHAGTGAIQANGTPHPEQVSLAELADGEFGNLVVEMIGYLAANYPVDAIHLTRPPPPPSRGRLPPPPRRHPPPSPRTRRAPAGRPGPATGGGA